MRFRQVHLDFHTSEFVKGIGSKFSKENFQHALKVGHVDSITVFSKCHHGWSYHPTKANIMHPELDFDLLGAQIEAAHEIGVKTPVYVSAGLDEKTARKHPEWLLRNDDDTPAWTPSWKTPGYHRFCFNTPYLDELLGEVKEVCENYDADGIFTDIVAIIPCYCQTCVAEMRRRGQDPYDPTNAYNLAVETYNNYTRRMRETVDSVKSGLPIFHNAGHLYNGRRDFAHGNTHLEVESLPTGGWGYDHFPMSAAYARTLDMEFLGMTGKFHKSWGEFGGFKHPNALRYEASLSLCNGAKISIGDQLHPLGFMDEATYKLIGAAYAEVEEKEAWCDHVTAVSDIAVLSQEGLFNHMHPGEVLPGKHSWKGTVGASRILLEGKYLFDVVDTETDFNNYKVLVMTDTSIIDETIAEKIRAFVKNGGKVLASGESAVVKGTKEFAVDLGAEYVGKAPFVPAYLRPKFEMNGLWDAAYCIYEPASEIKATGEVIGVREDPYFARTVEHFCSHAQTPNDISKNYPAITVGADGAYISFNVFTEYALTGCLIARETVCHVLDLLLGDAKSVTTNLPAQGVTTLMHQKDEHRYVHHLLYAAPVKRGQRTEIIEDLLPVYGTDSVLRIKETPKRVYLAPQMQDIPYTYENGTLSYTLDKLVCHQMVVIEY